MGPRLKFIIKIAVSAGLMGALIAWADWHAMAGALGRIPVLLLAAGLLYWGIDQLIGAWSLRILLLSRGVDVSPGRIASLYYTTGFFGFFLPSSMGPDLLRAVALSRGATSGAEAAGSILMLRFLSLLSLPVPFAAGAFLAFREDGAASWILAGGIGFAAFGAAVALVVAAARLGSRGGLRRLEKSAWLGRGLRFTAEVGRALLRYREDPGALVRTGILMAFTQVARILLAYLLALGMGAHPKMAHFFLTIPVVSFVVKLPVSVGGLGIGEGGLVVGFLQAGMVYEEALALALVLSALSFAVALSGGAVYLLGRTGSGEKAVPDAAAR